MRIKKATEGVIEPGVQRVETAYFRYNWMTREKDYFTSGRVAEIATRSEFERLYKFQLILPPFEHNAVSIDVSARSVHDTGDHFDFEKPLAPQVAHRFFTLSSSAFPGIGPEDPFSASFAGGWDQNVQCFVAEFHGKRFRVTVVEEEESCG